MTLSTENWILFVQEGSAVERFHSRPGRTHQTDGQHSHMVAMLCWALTEGLASTRLIMAALTHDLAEQFTGDVPAPAKWAMGMAALEAKENATLEAYGFNFPLEPAEERTLRLADTMEGMLHCCRERFFGNKYVDLAYYKWEANLTQRALSKPEMDVLQAIRSIWKRAVRGEAPTFDIYTEMQINDGISQQS